MRIRPTAFVAIAGALAAMAGLSREGAEMTDPPVLTLKAGRGSFLCLAVSPDGKLVAGGNKDGDVMLWDLTSRSLKANLKGHEGFVFALAFSPDGRTLASGGSDRTARLWDVAAAGPAGVLGGHEHWVVSLAFTADGKSLATATGSPSGIVRIWDLAAKAGRVVIRPENYKEIDTPARAICQIAFAPDGRTLAGSLATGIFLWDARGESVRLCLPIKLANRLTYAPDGKTLAVSLGHQVSLRDPESGRERAIIPDPKASGSISGLSFTGDGRKLAIGHSMGPNFPSVVRIWSLAAGEESTRFVTDNDSLRAVAFSPDGRTLATVADDINGKDGGVKLWDLSPPP